MTIFKREIDQKSREKTSNSKRIYRCRLENSVDRNELKDQISVHLEIFACLFVFLLFLYAMRGCDSPIVPVKGPAAKMVVHHLDWNLIGKFTLKSDDGKKIKLITVKKTGS